MRWTDNLPKRGLVIAAALVCLAAPARAQTIAERLAPCLACHGESGTSATPDVPSLGAQPAYFLLIQLFMFRERLRPIEPMTSMLKGVSDDDLRRMADALAKLPPPKPDASPADPERVTRAQELVAQHRCNFCHNGDYAGQENVPRIAGQREDYLSRRCAATRTTPAAATTRRCRTWSSRSPTPSSPTSRISWRG